MNDIESCPMCDGAAAALGTLGTLLHLRCVQCGWQWSVPAEQPDEEQQA